MQSCTEIKTSGKRGNNKDETILWDMGLLGANNAESLLNTVYFYNRKLFGVWASEHRLISLSNILVGENEIVFDECRCKKYKGHTVVM